MENLTTDADFFSSTTADFGDVINTTRPVTHPPLSVEEYILMGFYLVFADILSLIGNGFMIYIFLAKMDLNNPIYTLLLNISLANLIETVFGHSLATISSFEQRWVFGEIGCSWYGFVCFVTTLVAMLSFLAMCVYRYCVVCAPLQGAYFTTIEAFRKIIGVIWIYCLSWALLPFMGWGTYSQEPFLTSCAVKWQGENASEKSFVLMLFLSAYFLPVGSMLVLYIKIVAKTNTQVSHQQPTGNGNVDLTSAMHGVQPVVNIEKRMLMIITSTMVFFLVAWTPYAILSIAFSFGAPLTARISAIPTMFAKSQCGIFPFLCIFLHSQLRQSFFTNCCE